ncbi:hypothetical protein [Legionella waltersii]|uniref:Uncharacterized protein n=1 Tax=Legionella waltersii TaxID=66969 RepID=A0A0W1A2R2_9GAMM|nr:hypothetical protein [Legionella waltersii]KTD75590.1 hypothetical protein Lwal_2528 [Legionella waltersii]SNU98905.1 Uncharacterised protein [Legionella waltersii]
MFDESVQKKLILGLLSRRNKLLGHSDKDKNDNIKKAINLIEVALSDFVELGIRFDKASANSPVVNNSIFSAPSYHDNGSVLNSIETHEETFTQLRKVLYALTHTPEYASLLDEELLIIIHEFLIAVAQKKPFNDTNLLLNETIPEGQRVYTSSGHCFDVLELIQCYKDKKFINPYLNKPFSPIDICHILNRSIAYSQTHKDKNLMNFLKTFGPIPVMAIYMKSMVYLADDKGRVIGILPQSVLQFNLPIEKDKLIFSNRYLLQALFAGTMSMKDVSEIGVDNLSLINSYRKALDILCSGQAPLFIELAKTCSKLDLFEVLNSKQPYDEAIAAVSSSKANRLMNRV